MRSRPADAGDRLLEQEAFEQRERRHEETPGVEDHWPPSAAAGRPLESLERCDQFQAHAPGCSGVSGYHVLTVPQASDKAIVCSVPDGLADSSAPQCRTR